MEKKKKFNIKNILTGIGVILFYLFTSTFVTEILSVLGINYDSLSTTLKSICLIIYQILISIILYKFFIILSYRISDGLYISNI